MKLAAWILPFVLTLSAAQGQRPGGADWRLPDRARDTQGQLLPWGPSSAAHLMRRAGFSASPEQLRGIVEQGFEATLNQLLQFEAVDDSAMEEGLRQRAYSLVVYNSEMGVYYSDLLNLQRVWLYRMIHSRRQLLEKMTLFWHDHFATSIEGAPFANPERGPLLQIQNETLRRHALGNFRDMLYAVARDPAMTLWLNNFENRVLAPNENWARELMELFTMGEGTGYTETDVQEAARAFTGWSLNRQFDFQFLWFFHDFAPKTVLGTRIEHEPGETGMEDGDEVIDILLRQPATADNVARKLWEFFVYPDPPQAIVSRLARVFRDSDYDIRRLMEAIFRHPAFMSQTAYRAKVKSPVEFAVGACRELQVPDPQNLPLLLFFFPLGQQLYLPPDVGGWPSDRGWINTGSVLGRNNFMTVLSSKRRDLTFNLPGQDIIPVERIASQNGLTLGADFVDYFLEAMLQNDVSLDTRYTLEEYLQTGDGGRPAPFDSSDPAALDKKVRGLIQLIAFLPAYQLN